MAQKRPARGVSTAPPASNLAGEGSSRRPAASSERAPVRGLAGASEANPRPGSYRDASRIDDPSSWPALDALSLSSAPSRHPTGGAGAGTRMPAPGSDARAGAKGRRRQNWVTYDAHEQPNGATAAAAPAVNGHVSGTVQQAAASPKQPSQPPLPLPDPPSRPVAPADQVVVVVAAAANAAPQTPHEASDRGERADIQIGRSDDGPMDDPSAAPTQAAPFVHGPTPSGRRHTSALGRTESTFAPDAASRRASHPLSIRPLHGFPVARMAVAPMPPYFMPSLPQPQPLTLAPISAAPAMMPFIPGAPMMAPMTTMVPQALVTAPMPPMAMPFVVAGQPYAADESPLPAMIVRQVEYYFSAENLCKDRYLRLQMDADGWVPLTFIANFNRMRALSTDVGFIAACLAGSGVVQVDGDRVRCRNDWSVWPLTAPSTAGPATPAAASASDTASPAASGSPSPLHNSDSSVAGHRDDACAAAAGAEP